MTRGIVVADVGKLLMLTLVIVGVFALLLAGRVTWDEAETPLGIIVGYLVGNGVNAVRGSAPSSVVLPRLERDTFATVTGPAPVEPPEETSE